MEQVGATGGGINVAWETPIDIGSGGTIYYQVYMSPTRLTSPEWTLVYNSSENAFWKTRLTKTTEYFFIASCLNEVGYSDNSTVYTFSTSYVSVPGPVNDIEKLNATGGMVCFSWNEPDDNGGSPVASYSVYAIETAESTTNAQIVRTTSEAFICFGGLSARTEYSFSAYAINDLGEATDAVPGVFMTGNATAPSAPGEPVIVNTSGGAITLAIPAPSDTGGVSMLDLTFGVLANGIAIPSGSIRRLSKPLVSATPQRRLQSQEAVNRDQHARRLTEKDLVIIYIAVGNLLPTTSYDFSVYIESDAGPSAAAPTVAGTTQVATTPDAPDSPKALLVTGGALYLTWKHPVDTGGAMITSFLLLAKSGDAEVGRCDGLVLQCVVGNLLPLTDYKVTLVAINSVGPSRQSTEVVFTTDVPTIPGPPQKTLLFNLSSAQATITWEDCKDFGGTLVESYLTRTVEEQNASSVVEVTVPVTSLNVTLTRLSPATKYVVTVVRHLSVLQRPWLVSRISTN